MEWILLSFYHFTISHPHPFPLKCLSQIWIIGRDQFRTEETCGSSYSLFIDLPWRRKWECKRKREMGKLSHVYRNNHFIGWGELDLATVGNSYLSFLPTPKGRGGWRRTAAEEERELSKGKASNSEWLKLESRASLERSWLLQFQMPVDKLTGSIKLTAEEERLDERLMENFQKLTFYTFISCVP